MPFLLLSTLLQLLLFSLPALSVDPGAEAGGGRCPEAWQSCRGAQYSEFFLGTVLIMHCKLCYSPIVEGDELTGCVCVFNPNRCWPQPWWQTCPSSLTSCPDYSKAPSKDQSICESTHYFALLTCMLMFFKKYLLVKVKEAHFLFRTNNNHMGISNHCLCLQIQ